MNNTARFSSVLNRNIVKRLSNTASNKKKRIVILGSGWGSYSVLKNINRRLFDVKVISPRNHFLFTPLLCSTAVGTLEFRSITEPIRNIGFNDPNDFMLAYAEQLDTSTQTLHCRSALDPGSQFNVYYDKLVIGVGCKSNTFGVPGVEKFASFLKEIADAQYIRRKILTNCEKALSPTLPSEENKRLLHTVIVGGGPTGIEFEQNFMTLKYKMSWRLYQSSEEWFKVTLIEAGKVKEDCVILKDGTCLPCGLVVWSTGLSPQTFTKNLKLPKRIPRGTAVGDPKKNIYAVGDCASLENNPLPCTAQVAERQGRYLARALNSQEKGEEIKPFLFQSSGMLAYIGDFKALPDLPDFKIRGFTSGYFGDQHI
ncbi:internal alternative NAD(P)H-ubiquinone oxidoreductase A1, mitochondrial [Caerostris extrusa]|uniref:Internal alternative NAD(P)H-ubiquinone oxidoreductase A1, mitochondrial n=1 Tax=Caerostris extrusa TaxID=172846 RepID=A0AAV4RCT6_CAEEX|nr:internal alternative NAD(P)H-ubiquinone oxidoreductase A1, mitochondrial [Caerostris extrusa]